MSETTNSQANRNWMRITGFAIMILGLPLIFVGFIPEEKIISLLGKVEPEKLRVARIFYFAGAVLLFLSGIGLAVFSARIKSLILPRLEAYTDYWSRERSQLRTAMELFFISFLGLYFEIMIIRWMGTEVRQFAYFKNFTLIACFLGLGIGFPLARKKFLLLPFFSAGFLLFASTVLISKFLGVDRALKYSSHFDQEFAWDMVGTATITHNIVFYMVIIFFFFFIAALFIPMGQMTGRLMTRFTPIKAYTINIFGSILGVVAFALVSYLELSPIFWFGIGMVIILWFFQGNREVMIISSACFVIAVVLFLAIGEKAVWSPYQKIQLGPITYKSEDGTGPEIDAGYYLKVNEDYHQKIINLSRDLVREKGKDYPDLRRYALAYNLPYMFIENPGDICIVGAGGGNDVAAALRNGANSIDAVDIDPTILRLGKELHPEKPYADSRVRLIVDDARSYFKRTMKRYDQIIYGLLDSHTMLTAMSNVRLENFVYTLEGIEQAKKRLKPDGTIVLTFSIPKGHEFLGKRIYRVLLEVFGKEPLVYESRYDGGHMFIAGRAEPLKEIPKGVERIIYTDPEVELIYDDWPFLYTRERSIPRSYLIMIALVFVISAIAILIVFPDAKRINGHFFFLGSAFLLIEVKAITELALVYGTTWMVNSVVITSVLALILLANLYVTRSGNIKIRRHYILLFFFILLGYFFPLERLLGQSLILKSVISTILVFIPIFFAGIIFATSLKRFKSIEIAFGSNLLGAMMGGFFEYGSLQFGLKSMYLFGFGLYLLSYLSLRSWNRS